MKQTSTTAMLAFLLLNLSSTVYASLECPEAPCSGTPGPQNIEAEG